MRLAAPQHSDTEAVMAQTVGDFLLERLSQWGVKRIYGYPGDGINGIMGALGRNREMEFIQARHEELAAFMACAHAKFAGEIGVCLATSGPGAIHLLNGLYDAKMDHQPVLAIVGQQKRSGLGGDYQQEVDLVSLFKDVASEYVHMATTPAQVRHLVDRAVRIALEHRTVTCIVFPNDVQDMKAVATPPREHGTVHSGIGRSAFPYSEFLPGEGQARGVQIDIDGRMLSLRYPMEMNLVGDSKATLHALLPLLRRKTERSWREAIEKNVANWWSVLQARAMA